MPTNRRSFLKSAAAASTAFVAPNLIFAKESNTTTAMVGEGEHQYEAIHGWGELPDSIQWGVTQGVDFDKDGFIYVTHGGTSEEPQDAIVVFDPDGKYVRSFAKEYHGAGHGLEIREENGEQFIYFCACWGPREGFAKMTLSGEVLFEINKSDLEFYEKDSKYKPTSCAFLPDGDFFLSDGYGQHYIFRVSTDGEIKSHFGGRGKEPGQFSVPHGLWVDDRGDEPFLMVTNRGRNELLKMTLDGELIETQKGVTLCCDYHSYGDIAVVPGLASNLELVDRDMKTITKLGYDAEWAKKAAANKRAMRMKPDQWEAGRFLTPHDAKFDADGNIFCVEWVPTGRVTKLRKV